MGKDVASVDKRPVAPFRLLLCDTSGDVSESSAPDQEWIPTAIQCLDKAVEGKPEIIVVRVGRVPLAEREALLELCAVLKGNSHTRTCPILALLPSKHRKVLEDLWRVGVDFARFIGDAALDPLRIRDIIKELGPDDRLERHLAVLCPFLHYDVIDSEHEMTVCGAYLDRMVLGGRRLHEICETEDHLHCEYYLNPRLES